MKFRSKKFLQHYKLCSSFNFGISCCESNASHNLHGCKLRCCGYFFQLKAETIATIVFFTISFSFSKLLRYFSKAALCDWILIDLRFIFVTLILNTQSLCTVKKVSCVLKKNCMHHTYNEVRDKTFLHTSATAARSG